MANYYDRLESQLARATERAPARRRFGRRPRVSGLRADWLVAALAGAVAVAVAAAFIGIGGHRRPVASHGVTGGGLSIVHNYLGGRLPALGGQLVCATNLEPPDAGKSPSGTATINNRPPTSYAFSVNASGLQANVGHNAYAVWLSPAVQTLSGSYTPMTGEAPLFVGIVRPGVGRNGRLRLQGLLPEQANGAYRFVVTLQPHPSATKLGRIILEGFIAF